jgi:hypothetical protein
LFLYAYLLRPELSAWAGGDGNDPARALAGGGWLAALGYSRLAAHDAQSLVRLGWFVTPPGLVLAVLGLLLLIRDFRARHALALAIVFTFAAFYLYKTRISSDYFFALRRFLPVVLPGLVGFAALALTTLAERGRSWRGAAVVAGAGLATAYGLETSRIAEHVDWREAAGFVSQVADLFGPQDVVLAEQESSVEMVALPLWAVHGVKVLMLGQREPDPARVALLVNDRRANGGTVFLLGTHRSDQCALFTERVRSFDLRTSEWERSYTGPPRRSRPMTIEVSVGRVPLPGETPVLDDVDVGGFDDRQVSGVFFDRERAEGRTFRWSGRCALVQLPPAGRASTLVVTAAAGERPSDEPALVRVSTGGRLVGSFTAGAEWAEHAVPLPSNLSAGPLLLRFDVAGWRPSKTLPGSTDDRDLGVMVDRIALRPGS